MTKIKRSLKYKIARALFFLPDPLMLRLEYYAKLKRWPNLKNPQRFTEKLEHYKAYYRNPEMLRCTDKYLVRQYVSERMGNESILNTLYQVCDDAAQIDFKALPDQFVVKTTDGGDGDNVFICRDKNTVDWAKTIHMINQWRNQKKYYVTSREWAYSGIRKSRIIVERYLWEPSNKDGSIDDYKFLCYDGKFRFLWVDKNRYSNHRRGFWNEHLEFLSGVRSDWPTFDEDNIPPLPANIQEMITVAEQLASGFPFARIDLYNIQGRIIFGEITFYPWSGHIQYTPDSFDFDLGKPFNTNYPKA